MQKKTTGGPQVGLSTPARRGSALAVIVAVLTVSAIGVIHVQQSITSAGETNERPRLDPQTVTERDVGERHTVDARKHIWPLESGHWSTDPPSSGEHYAIPGYSPSGWGLHEDNVPPEVWVHNLEHGGIAVLYRCSTHCPERGLIQVLLHHAPRESLFNEVKIIAVAYPVPSHRFALVAWGWTQFMDRWDEYLAERFYRAHVDQGPERTP
jgi:hypothetical protein